MWGSLAVFALLMAPVISLSVIAVLWQLITPKLKSSLGL